MRFENGRIVEKPEVKKLFLDVEILKIFQAAQAR